MLLWDLVPCEGSYELETFLCKFYSRLGYVQISTISS